MVSLLYKLCWKNKDLVWCSAWYGGLGRYNWASCLFSHHPRVRHYLLERTTCQKLQQKCTRWCCGQHWPQGMGRYIGCWGKLRVPHWVPGSQSSEEIESRCLLRGIHAKDPDKMLHSLPSGRKPFWVQCALPSWIPAGSAKVSWH